MTNPSNTPRRSTPGEELLDGMITGVAVWGTAIGLGYAANIALSAIGLSHYGWRLGLSGIVTYLTVLSILLGGQKRPDLRNAFLAWRYPIAILVAGYVGYSLHSYVYSKSNEALVNNAARWACSRNQQCVHAAEQYLADKNLD